MIKFTKLAIEKKQVTLTCIFLIIAFGLISFSRLPQAEDPGFTVRKARVVTLFPGASPERVEQLITDRLEKVIQEMPEMEFVTSESRTGISVITVKMWDRYKDMQPIWQTLRRKIAKETHFLPETSQGPYINDEFGDVFGTVVAITGPSFSYRDLKKIADDVQDQLFFIQEVAKVEIFGAQEERIYIEYSDAKLAELGMSSMQLKNLLESRNIVTPGGSVVTENERIILEPSGNFESVDDLQNALIHLPGWKQVLPLKDIVTVKRGYIDPATSVVNFSGKPALLLAVSMREGSNISKLGNKVQSLVEKLNTSYPNSIRFDFLNVESAIVSKQVNTFIMNLLQSLTIVLVIMLFALGARSGLIVSSLIPLTILLTFFLMHALDIGIDQTSLAALIIALGMLVDSGVVITESAATEMEKGKTPTQAAIASAKEHTFSLLTSSLTTIAAFLPIYMAKSMAGEYTASLFKVVTIALLSSWILSITVLPMFCVIFGRKRKLTFGSFGKVGQWYKAILPKVITHAKSVVAGFVIIFFIACASFSFVPKAFFPRSDRGQFKAKLELPVGTKIEKTQKIVKKIEQYLLEQDHVVDFAAFIGGTMPRYVLNFNPFQMPPEEAFFIINTTGDRVIGPLMGKIEQFVNHQFPEAIFSLEETKYGPPVAAPVAIRISGDDQESLFAVSAKIKEEFAKRPGMKNIRDDWKDSSKKIIAEINQARALLAGITSKDVAISLQTRLSGFDTTKYREKEELIPVVLRSQSKDRENLDKLESLNVYSQTTGIQAPLKQVADLKLQWQPNNILRRNLKRTITVMADLEPGMNAQKIANSFIPWLTEEKNNWSSDIFYEFGGEKESSEVSSRSIANELPFAALLIILLLVAEFNCLKRAFIVLTTIPMAIIGVVFGLLLTGSYLGFMTLLGIVSLAGIVVNDAIVLLERVTHEINSGKEPFDALQEACSIRLRPILLTSWTTIGGMLTLCFGAPMFKPLAIAIIFGLAFATYLTLLFVPALYAVLFKVSGLRQTQPCLQNQQ